jgi:hypothetical protein
MMAAALGTGDPLAGAALMFAFTLGTSPVFFAVSYFATRLGARLEKNFMRFVAVVVLVMAVVTIDSGAVLAGSPVSLTRWVTGIFTPQSQAAAAPLLGQPTVSNALDAIQPEADASSSLDTSLVTVSVENWGYAPEVTHAKAGVPIQLKLVSQNVRSCALAFVIPSLNVQKLLKPTGEEIIDIPAQEAGSVLTYSCSMGMYGGQIIFDL